MRNIFSAPLNGSTCCCGWNIVCSHQLNCPLMGGLGDVTAKRAKGKARISSCAVSGCSSVKRRFPSPISCQHVASAPTAMCLAAMGKKHMPGSIAHDVHAESLPLNSWPLPLIQVVRQACSIDGHRSEETHWGHRSFTWGFKHFFTPSRLR